MNIRQSAGLVAVLAVSLATPLLAQAPPGMFTPKPVPTPPQPGAIMLYPGMAAGKIPESWAKFQDDYIARNVSQPTLTPYLPAPGKATGAAIIVLPGGGYVTLSITREGAKVAQMLADHGIAAFVLKYRLNETPADDARFSTFAQERMQRIEALQKSGRAADVSEPRAVEDAAVALQFVRDHAARFAIDPQRVGMMGFSAGARTVMAEILTAKSGTQPDFIGYIYGPMLPVQVPADAPPMFAALAMDDPLLKGLGFGIAESWRKAGRPVELHVYEHGSHGFGLGVPGTTSALMPEEFLAWLKSHGLLEPRK